MGRATALEIEQHPAAEISASLKGFIDAPQGFRKHVMTGCWHVMQIQQPFQACRSRSLMYPHFSRNGFRRQGTLAASVRFGDLMIRAVSGAANRKFVAVKLWYDWLFWGGTVPGRFRPLMLQTPLAAMDLDPGPQQQDPDPCQR